MSKRTYEEYIKNGCHPVGYNEPCQSYYFGQVSVDWLLDQIDQLKQQLAEKEKENEELKLKLDIRAMNLQNINTERMEAVRNQTQLTLQELEKVKTLIQNAINFEKPNFVEVYDTINKQINDLRGTKDVED